MRRRAVVFVVLSRHSEFAPQCADGSPGNRRYPGARHRRYSFGLQRTRVWLPTRVAMRRSGRTGFVGFRRQDDAYVAMRSSPVHGEM